MTIDRPVGTAERGRGLRVLSDARGARERDVVRLREAGWLASEIARALGISRGRVVRMIERAGGVDRERALAARPGLHRRRAQDRSREILDHYCRGADPRLIARELGLERQAVERVVRERSTDADRLRRSRALASARRPRFSDEQLLDGIVRIALTLGRVPTGVEYDRSAAEVGLASRGTAVSRFDGWHNALHAAGLKAPPQQRSSYWDHAACWRALDSVADQLGDPPRYRRYLNLAGGRDDLPSGQVVRDRLGLWSQVSAELTRRGLGSQRQSPRVNRVARIRPRPSPGTRSRERRAVRAIPGRRPRPYTREQLIAGVRAVAKSVGHAPSGGEYRRLAEPLDLASLATVYNRFGNWTGALTAAGYQPAAPRRTYTKKWDERACWTALQSVAEQLGDRPSYRRYEQQAAGREDLPSGPTVRQRLGLWSDIAAALVEQHARDGHRPLHARAATATGRLTRRVTSAMGPTVEEQSRDPRPPNTFRSSRPACPSLRSRAPVQRRVGETGVEHQHRQHNRMAGDVMLTCHSPPCGLTKPKEPAR